jgi:uncharacterized RDD family membrane protein YckC
LRTAADVAREVGLPQELIIHTPENAEIRVPLAGMFSRAAAFVHDVLLQMMSLVFVHIGFVFFMEEFRMNHRGLYSSQLLQGLHLLVLFVMVFGYYTYYELFAEGQTPGKKAYNLRVVTLSGQRVGLFSSLLRNFLRIADFMPFMFMAGLLSALITDRHQRIGDLFAGTVVIITEEVLPK